jgi:hypothetical protein
LPHLSLIHGWPIALGATARPTKPASSSTVAGGEGNCRRTLFCNRAAWEGLQAGDDSADGRLARSAQAAAASWSQAGASASISEAALPIERDSSITTEAAELGLVNRGL